LSSWSTSLNASTTYSADVTPLVLAAHRNSYEIVKILLDRGDTVTKPHDVRCSCTECKTLAIEDSLAHSLSRINAYRALASSSLIALSSTDPILTAFELSHELKLLSLVEIEYRVCYESYYVLIVAVRNISYVYTPQCSYFMIACVFIVIDSAVQNTHIGSIIHLPTKQHTTLTNTAHTLMAYR